MEAEAARDERESQRDFDLIRLSFLFSTDERERERDERVFFFLSFRFFFS